MKPAYLQHHLKTKRASHVGKPPEILRETFQNSGYLKTQCGKPPSAKALEAYCATIGETCFFRLLLCWLRRCWTKTQQRNSRLCLRHMTPFAPEQTKSDQTLSSKWKENLATLFPSPHVSGNAQLVAFVRHFSALEARCRGLIGLAGVT